MILGIFLIIIFYILWRLHVRILDLEVDCHYLRVKLHLLNSRIDESHTICKQKRSIKNE